MRTVFSSIALFCSLLVLGQPDSLHLIYHWNDVSIEYSEFGDNKYNEVFGYAQNGKEYAIVGSTMGTHIFTLEDGAERQLVFIPGGTSGRQVVHRDFDVYENYLYSVADQGETSSLQIIDLSLLPDTAELVYNSNEYIIRSHNIFIDQKSRRLYSCGGAISGVVPGFAQVNHLSIYSLENPEKPKLLLDCKEQLGFWQNIGYIHDIYVRNDTAYCNAGNKGLFVVDFTSLTNVRLLGSLREYDQKGYNHQGFLHASKPYYAMTDETHGMDIKMIDVSDLKEMEILDKFSSEVSAEYSVPHNVYWLGDYIYASYYADGVYIFDASDPRDVKPVFSYDTNEKDPDKDFDGCWGVYPFLPSGKLLATDMRNGLFVFWPPFKPLPEEPKEIDLTFGSNLVKNELTITNHWEADQVSIQIVSIEGQNVIEATLIEGENIISLPSSLRSGWYSAKLSSETELKYFRFYIY